VARAGPAVKPDAKLIAVYMGRGATTYRGMRIPQGGCAGEAQRRFGDIVPLTDTLAKRLEIQANEKARADAATHQASARWSECMKGKGYSYTDPWAANNDSAFAGKNPTRKEIATAVADVACKRAGNLVGEWYAVEKAYQLRAIAANRTSLIEERVKWERYSALAERIRGAS
jgi:hypothetical protein